MSIGRNILGALQRNVDVFKCAERRHRKCVVKVSCPQAWVGKGGDDGDETLALFSAHLEVLAELTGCYVGREGLWDELC